MSSPEASALASAIAMGQANDAPDVSRGPLLVRTVWVLISISIVVVCGRLFSKFRKTRRFYWDDALVMLALVIGIFHAAWITRGVHHGLGRHMMHLSEEQRTASLRVGLWSLLLAFLSPMCGRMAFCVTLLYLTGTDPKVKKWPVWAFLVGQVLVNFSVLLAFYTQCGSHLSIFWSPTKVAEFAVDCPGFKRIWDTSKLTLTKSAMIASIVKTYEARVLSAILDYTYDLCPYVIWISIELNVVIIVASIPLLRPLFVQSFPQHRRSRNHSPRRTYDSATSRSIYSRKGADTSIHRPESQETIFSQPKGIALQDLHLHRRPSEGIMVQQEVTITYESHDLPYVHAALVGLVQGEISNPSLVKR
ncbi:hypothetical protein LTR62_006386 [Meristemomyces frigidus]|uniref:Rhodopsin domain-containing protein n=1 Tax=Meristemomyces frigidus TaxID=1508187 RepID=A0AAN7TNI0_9PEZI|nr:hypothetical protein LTR62_006386 [Meristemomyces frigidus]